MRELSPDAKNIKVLVVDDAPSMRSLLVAILKSFGIQNVYESTDGNSAIATLEKRVVDLVICDWEMPKKDGLELFSEIRKQESYKNVPFILVTSMAELDKVKVAIKAGVEHYIVKPFKEDTIFNEISGIFDVVTEEKQVP